MPKESTQFKKGVSGNPRGRPKGSGTHQRREAREAHTLLKAQLSNLATGMVNDLQYQQCAVIDALARADLDEILTRHGLLIENRKKMDDYYAGHKRG